MIKSHLLCQLSYAPTANSTVERNLDYSIRFLPTAHSCCNRSRGFLRIGLNATQLLLRGLQLFGLRWVWVPGGETFMLRKQFIFSALIAGVVLLVMLVNNAGAQVPIRTGPPTSTRPVTKPPRLEPCWQVAGVSRAALQQRRSIEQQGHAEIQSVCANSSLSLAQKRQQIRQIHERQRQEIDGLISISQQEAMRTCQEERNHGGHGGGHGGGGHGGPCGEMSFGTKGHPMEEDETPASETTKPN